MAVYTQTITAEIIWGCNYQGWKKGCEASSLFCWSPSHVQVGGLCSASPCPGSAQSRMKLVLVGNWGCWGSSSESCWWLPAKSPGKWVEKLHRGFHGLEQTLGALIFLHSRNWSCRRFNMSQQHSLQNRRVLFLSPARRQGSLSLPLPSCWNGESSRFHQRSPGRTTTICHCQQPVSWVHDSLQSCKPRHFQAWVISFCLGRSRRAAHRGGGGSRIQPCREN